jgi:hypothetical protein
MKKRLLFLLILVMVLLGNFYLLPKTASAAECIITSAKFILDANTPNSINHFFTDDTSQPEVKLSIAGENCNRQTVNISLIEGGAIDDFIEPLINQQFMFPDQGNLEITTRAGETKCSILFNPNCEYLIKVTVYNTITKQITQTFTNSDILKFNCSPDGCLKSWEFVSDNQPEDSPFKICRVTKAWFDPHMTASTPKKDIEDFFFDSNKQKVNVHVQTNHCVGKTIEVSILENDHGYLYDSSNIATKDSQGNTTDDAISVLDDKDFIIDSKENLTITLRAGEDECEQKTTLANDTIGISGVGIDCEYYIDVSYPTTDGKGTFNSIGKTAGLLAYECENSCDEPWGFVGDSITVDQEATELESLTGLTDPNSACKDNPDCYELFAGFGKALGEKFATVKPSSLGDFINMLVMFAIGIFGIILFVRIFLLGFQIAQDKKDGKVVALSDTKEELLKAVGGFILLLCIFIILRTINPDLLNLTPRIDALSLEVKSRTDDPNAKTYIDSIDTSEITSHSDGYDDETFLTYLGHQQGAAGAASILWAYHRGYSSIPNSTPFLSNASVTNMRMQKNYFGSGTATPQAFLDYWWKKTEANKKKTGSIPEEINTVLKKVAADTNVSLKTIQVMCMIESFGCSNPNAVNGSYKGLFQMGPSEFATYKRNGATNIFDPYENAYAGAMYSKSNYSYIKKKWNKILP